MTTNHTQVTVGITTPVSRLFLSIAISKQVYAAPYLAVRMWLLLREEPVPAIHCAGQLAISLTSRPMTMVFGFGTRLHVRMCTKGEKWHPSQRIAARVCCEQLVKVELELWRN